MPSRLSPTLRVADLGGGWSEVSTQTRIVGTDDNGRRVFARYWRVIYPGSAIIRRMWLKAIAPRAPSGRPPEPAGQGPTAPGTLHCALRVG